MPQLTEFPYLGEMDPASSVAALVKVCRDLPVEGITLRDLRERLRNDNLWDRERLAGTLRFFRMSEGDVIVPAEPMRAVATAGDDDAAQAALAERLWHVNPVLFKAVVEHLAERVSPAEELYSYIDSFAYPGSRVGRAHLRSWVQLARGVGILKVIGIALGLGPRATGFQDRARRLDVSEFLAEDQAEELPPPIRRGGAADPEDAAAAAPAGERPALPTARVPMTAPAGSFASPLGRGAPVAPARFAGQTLFDDELLAETSGRLAGWWSEQSPESESPRLAEFGIDGETWMEGADEALYRLAVAAALAFRLGVDRAGVAHAFAGLQSSGVLSSLYFGTAPEGLAEGVDPRALMLASLVARRVAEHPDLAAELEKQKSAADAFAVLDGALGRGLFRMELFWIMRGLGEVGAIRFADLTDYTALPHRLVRDTLFRLGFLASPYAADAAALTAAAAAAHRAAGEVAAADEVLSAFAVSAGCAYDCPNRRRCEFACRERAE